MRVEFTPETWRDLRELARRLGHDSPVRTIAVALRLLWTMDKHRGRGCDEIRLLGRAHRGTVVIRMDKAVDGSTLRPKCVRRRAKS